MNTQLWNVLRQINGPMQTDLVNFYQSAQGINNVTNLTLQDIKNAFNTTTGSGSISSSDLGISMAKVHNAITQKPFISPSSYTNQTVQYLQKTLIGIANIATSLSSQMVDSINNDTNSISDDSSVDPSANPLNADIFKAQVIQDFAFIISIALIYLANTITGTQNSPTILFNPEISCSDTIATSIFATLNPANGTPASTLITNLLSGNVTATLPTIPTTISISPTLLYAAVCAFVNAYDANSTSGPYQPQINSLISMNNAIQTL